MNIDFALEKIYSLKQFHVKLGLDNITDLLSHLGNPQYKIKTFHVAGSNGKGSTCSFLASILQEAGFKVGLYTSPHFVRFNERIRINGQEIVDEKIIEFLEKNKQYIDEKKPTFFEITTAMAFEHFAKNKVDYAIIETGLGGRLDATNTITPLASVITSISLEHSHILGESLSEIAYEKGGIIKNKIPVFIGVIPKEAEDKIGEICKERNSELFKLKDFIIEKEAGITLTLKEELLKINNTGLKGKYQLFNSALASKVLNEMLAVNKYKIIQKGIDNVMCNTGIQGRYELYNQTPAVIFDAAHNLEGVEQFIQEFKQEYKKYDETYLIFGAMKDKPIVKMLKILAPYFNRIILTASDYERAASINDLTIISNDLKLNYSCEVKPASVIDAFLKKNENKCLVVLGSIYLIGGIKSKMIHKRLDF
ncbi:MAG: bifunctional tetrahydrofolate synthase/dihydrofolate synthase [Ignavibacteriae bacterium]|nr:MAG: bifunctional tetrahydrofolate synthase/dihydrofolate synthase [Ignavibacteriota bacterium]